MGNRDCYLVDLSRSLIPEGGGRVGSGEENVDLSQIEFLFSVPQRASVRDGKVGVCGGGVFVSWS